MRRRGLASRGFTATAALALAVSAAVAGCAGPRREVVSTGSRARQLQAEVAAVPRPKEPRLLDRWTWLHSFYRTRGHAPAWTGPSGVLGRADELLAELALLADHGLDPADYGYPLLQRAVVARRAGLRLPGEESSWDRGAARLDAALTAAFLACADDLRRGAVDPATVSEEWGVGRGASDLSGLLSTAIDMDAVGQTLRRMAPPGPEYAGLRQAMVRARQQGRATAGPDPGVDRLRVNLERWRWLPREMGSRYLLVRIADFELDLVEDGRVRSTRRVIVGEPFRRTPLFASQITHLVVHPSWYVPRTIAAEEMIPALRADPHAHAGRDLEVWVQTGGQRRRVDPDSVDWSAEGLEERLLFVQRPGAANPLGRVKFSLPNRYAVYLHDTPGSGLFARAERDLSHGCVRVEDALGLARALLEGSPTATAAFEETLASATTGQVSLPEPVPTYVMYWTARASGDGEVEVVEDLYGADARLAEALDAVGGLGAWTARLALSEGPATRPARLP